MLFCVMLLLVNTLFAYDFSKLPFGVNKDGSFLVERSKITSKIERNTFYEIGRALKGKFDTYNNTYLQINLYYDSSQLLCACIYTFVLENEDRAVALYHVLKDKLEKDNSDVWKIESTDLLYTVGFPKDQTQNATILQLVKNQTFVMLGITYKKGGENNIITKERYI